MMAVSEELQFIDLILLLSSKDGSLLRYIHVFRIIQNVQEGF